MSGAAEKAAQQRKPCRCFSHLGHCSRLGPASSRLQQAVAGAGRHGARRSSCVIFSCIPHPRIIVHLLPGAEHRCAQVPGFEIKCRRNKR